MATPTETVTRRAQEYLGDDYDVVIALRVEWGAGAAEAAARHGAALFAHVWAPIVLPVLSKVRERSAKQRMSKDPAAGVGVLALTRDEQRILLSAMPGKRKTPTGVVATLPPRAPLLPDIELMETDVVPVISVGDYDLVVDRVDLKALLHAVEAGEIDSPDLAAHLDRFRAVGQQRYGWAQ